MINLTPHTKAAFAYFIFAAVLGVVLRSFHSVDLAINYKFFVHTHSHIALLGWVYVALTILLYKLFVQDAIVDKKYRYLFWFTQLTLLGMLLTFPFQGYALISILFSTLFLFASYWFFWFFRKHVKGEFRKTKAYKCVNAALWYLIISSLGPWALGAVMNIWGPESVWYRLAIYFYLHFLYNGWMLMAIFGLFFHMLERHGIHPSKKTFKLFFKSINLGILLTFFLSTLFAKPPLVLNVLGGAGAVLQLFALAVLILFFVRSKGQWVSVLSNFQNHLLKTVGLLLVLKMALQLLTALPYFANLAAMYLDFTIGYLHGTFLGVVSISLFLFFDFFKLIRISKKGYWLYLLGFVITEALIFLKGIVSWLRLSLFDGYFELLALGSLLIPLSLLLIVFGTQKGSQV
ncbi:hypothetical protein [uncultured Kriegella sp.]|uniref:hypothetical protein n=1 Tax=uncultured Kriegella sp. TaxID=1798910 RepID=UPI0030D83D66|tara:strand:- start:27847 stop:29055 length:1209 start_codon:yes stop_codon:yes gene_type:complete